jgi:hypothetical protein
MPYEFSKDPYAQTSAGLNGIPGKLEAVTPSDTTDFTTYKRGLMVIVGGNVNFLPAQNDDGDTVTMTSLASGDIIQCRVRRVLAAGTTATVRAIP